MVGCTQHEIRKIKIINSFSEKDTLFMNTIREGANHS